MIIEIDPKAGLCMGVSAAIDKAEKELLSSGRLYCLGQIVHNSIEIARLEKSGLITIDYPFYKQLKNATVLIRAHGEPPETFKIALENNIALIDATCPVVLKLQERIKKSYANGENEIIIYGKKGHAEVNGLNGQINNLAYIVDNPNNISHLNLTKPVHLFSQTTMNVHEYAVLVPQIKKEASKNGNSLVTVHNTICRQVSGREQWLKDFAQMFDLMLFAGGENSSNGKFLFEICKSVNQNSIYIDNINQLDTINFDNIARIGISGATSTPLHQLELVKDRIFQLTLI